MVCGSVTADAGAGAVAYLVARRWGAVQYGQRGTRMGDGVGAVRASVDVEGGSQTGRSFGQFPVIAGRDSTFTAELGTQQDLARPEQYTARQALVSGTTPRTCSLGRISASLT